MPKMGINDEEGEIQLLIIDGVHCPKSFVEGINERCAALLKAVDVQYLSRGRCGPILSLVQNVKSDQYSMRGQLEGGYANELEEVDILDSDKQTNAKSSKVRTFANGLVIEELSMDKPDGKKAQPGKKVSVHYIGKLKKNGKQFDSNVGRAPFKFRLGVGQVIKGWDVGVEGMRVGDKRRLTIPPEIGYGAGGAIPPNSWLVFDVELNDVR
ncbi:peptidyl-prolyl cis-trans isomerase FKBP15-3-like [Humulus lupulus]|uniref:peptidyl-prolyl cis-trans isomerase FKBP15-3-like n=1 Tax=Humulus lupulus TaxID=3486 RepID=UPI002B413C42|nr:peptidyl-prolyl cis-trans isomerase FKBP15-3-like [Humulus lupulus]